MAPKSSQSNRPLGILLSKTGILTAVVTAILIATLSYGIYRYLFVNQVSEFTMNIEDMRNMTFNMDASTCSSKIDSKERQYVKVQIVQPANSIYEVRSGTEPISTSLAFVGGRVDVETIQSGSTITNAIDMHVRSRVFRMLTKSMKVDYGTPDNAHFEANICSEYVKFLSGGSVYSGIKEQSIFTNQDSIYTTKPITVTLNDVNIGQSHYETMTLKFISDKSPLISRNFSTLIYGNEVFYNLPFTDIFGSTFSKSYVSEAKSKNFIIEQPIGEITILREGNKEIKSSRSLLSNEKIEFESSASNDILFQFAYLDGLPYQATGAVSNVYWLGNNLIHSRWETLSPEVQVLLASFGVSLLIWFSRRMYLWRKVTQRHTPPSGSLILQLYSGRAVAGKSTKRRYHSDDKYVLTDVMFRDQSGIWSNTLQQEVIIEASKVEFSYEQPA